MTQETLKEAMQSIQYGSSALERRDGSREAIFENAHDRNHRSIHLVYSQALLLQLLVRDHLLLTPLPELARSNVDTEHLQPLSPEMHREWTISPHDGERKTWFEGETGESVE